MSLWGKIAIWLTQRIQTLAEKVDPSPSISGLYPPFEAKIEALLIAARAHGMEVGLFEGFRSWEKQAQIFAQGRTKPGKVVTKAPPGHSWHNFGLAADVVFRAKGKWSWAESHPWSRLGALGKELGLEWGGDWKRFPDRPHFEWKDKPSLASARLLYQKGGVRELWRHLPGIHGLSVNGGSRG